MVTKLTAEEVLRNQNKQKNYLRKRKANMFRTKTKCKARRQKRVKKRVAKERAQGITEGGESKVLSGFFKYQPPSTCKRFTQEEIEAMNK